MITRDKITTMLELQDKLNAKINPDWLKANYPWHRAIMVESVEALEHYGWKWWKKQEPDLAQARIELVDIWHFILSMRLAECGGDVNWAADSLESSFSMAQGSTITTVKKIDELVRRAAQGTVGVGAFTGLMNDFKLSWDDLYTMYIGKNVLNTFRQDNGYKAGTYQKMWDGKEDNVCLDTLMKLRPDATPEQLMTKLGQIYTALFSETTV